MKRSTQIVILVSLLMIGVFAVVAMHIRDQLRLAASHSCVASINARLQHSTNAVIVPGTNGGLLAYEQATSVLQRWYGELDCGCYDTNRVPCDPWGRPIVVMSSKEGHLRACSLGADGKFETADDIR